MNQLGQQVSGVVVTPFMLDDFELVARQGTTAVAAPSSRPAIRSVLAVSNLDQPIGLGSFLEPARVVVDDDLGSRRMSRGVVFFGVAALALEFVVRFLEVEVAQEGLLRSDPQVVLEAVNVLDFVAARQVQGRNGSSMPPFISS